MKSLIQGFLNIRKKSNSIKSELEYHSNSLSLLDQYYSQIQHSEGVGYWLIFLTIKIGANDKKHLI